MRDYPSLAKPPSRRIAEPPPPPAAGAQADADRLVPEGVIAERAHLSASTLKRYAKAGLIPAPVHGLRAKRYWLNATLAALAALPTRAAKPAHLVRKGPR